MTKLKRFRYLITVATGILSLVFSPGITGRALALQSGIDISVKVVADKSRVRFGENVTYTVTTTNLGSDIAPFVDVFHELPDQLQLVSMTCDRGISPDTPFCEYSFINPGETVVSTAVATPKSDSQNRAHNITMNANIFFENLDTVDTDNSNNSASVVIKLIGSLHHP